MSEAAQFGHQRVACTGMTKDLVRTLVAAFEAPAREADHPYRHWILDKLFPDPVAAALHDLPLPIAAPGEVSGKRELHNDTRRYFDAEAQARFPACAAVAAAFQSDAVVAAIEAATGADLDGTFVRLEYAQDVTGFWLRPHTDLGVKKFTLLIYLSRDPAQADLGTDIYADAATWAARPPFLDNTALMFVPADNTWHGLEKRPIAGVRKSVIMNYVTEAWIDREQLSSATPVRGSKPRA